VNGRGITLHFSVFPFPHFLPADVQACGLTTRTATIAWQLALNTMSAPSEAAHTAPEVSSASPEATNPGEAATIEAEVPPLLELEFMPPY
jgi:hypothetical protein